MACQHMISAIAYMYMFGSEFTFASINYVDDMEKDCTNASTVFLQLGNLFQRLGLGSSRSKTWPPSTCKPFPYLVYDTVKVSTVVPQDKLDSITLVVCTWLNTPCATQSALQFLIGKLVFVSAYISLSRIFMQHLHVVNLEPFLILIQGRVLDSF